MPSSGFNDIELNYGRLTPASEGVVKAETNGDVYFVVLARHSLSFVSMFVDINLRIGQEGFIPRNFSGEHYHGKVWRFVGGEGCEKIFEVENSVVLRGTIFR